MVEQNKISLRNKITHGMAKVIIPMAVHHAWLMFKHDDCVVSDASDLSDSNYKFYKDHYYKIIRKTLDNSTYTFVPESVLREAIDVSFTLIDSDGAYETLFKTFYEEEEKYFWKKFCEENFQINHE